MRREAEFLENRFGYRSEIVAKADMGRHIASPLYYGGIHDPQAGHFHPLNYAIGLAQAAEAVGVRIRENDPVLAINTRGGGPTELVTERTVITARHVIDATDSNTEERRVGKECVSTSRSRGSPTT